MGFACGIVGLPNVGKSTLFNALTSSKVSAENYPFCTVEPNLGVVPVPDTRIQRLAEVANSQRIVPSSMSFVDIAGLVEGASHGEGLGNQFLSHIREVDAIAHVVRCFADQNIAHVSGAVSPVRDIETINTELILADMETASRAESRVRKVARAGSKEDKALLAVLEAILSRLDQNQPIRSMNLDSHEEDLVRSYRFLSAKPVMYVANVDEETLDGGALADEVQAYAIEDGSEFVVVCSKVEAEIAQLETDEERQEFLAIIGLEEPGLVRVIRIGYQLLGLHHFFTVGPKETRAWTIPVGTTADKAAGKIHTDFQRGFIRAEVVSWDTFLKQGGEQACRNDGLMRAEGKGYEIMEGDVVHFLFNV